MMDYRPGFPAAASDNDDDEEEEEEEGQRYKLLPNMACQSQVYMGGVESICHKQQELVKRTMECRWRLAEAQQRLCDLELHNSESLEQERAKAQTEFWELKQKEDEWRQKEEELIWNERLSSWNIDTDSKEGFNKSVINKNIKCKEVEEDGKNVTFAQKYNQQIRHFGMLKRWIDSQRYLSDHPHLVCQETANYLIKWCFHLKEEEKQALMEQVAHQAVVMQFIIELGRSLQEDPRGCFRQFFEKAKVAEEGYMEAFNTELAEFIQRVREFAEAKTAETELKRCFQLQDVHVLQNMLSNMNPQVAEHYLQRCIDAGLRIYNTKEAKEERNEEPKMDLS
ncbi:hsp90 co-chaperone Cdc37-like 1 isoform X2 [Carcharodon carcharias]|uniref:hsp90 co-chaperone Cdc37-like 1 isoform X2 n=1 Tax=Carcharodon carcharias TaxID=13397 RepID=UPI001B7EB207|nr:hsp90 co-chaperone Cdc37-like 1 isoform X2 [Carcharodon carcharias]